VRCVSLRPCTLVGWRHDGRLSGGSPSVHHVHNAADTCHTLLATASTRIQVLLPAVHINQVCAGPLHRPERTPQGGPKTGASHSWPQFCQILTDFNFLTGRFPVKFVVEKNIKNPTAPCICCYTTFLVKHECQQNKPLTQNYKVLRLHIEGLVEF